MRTFVTFGQAHRHEINGEIFDKDCVAVIDCDGPDDGRKKAFEIFGRKFCFEYFDSEVDRIDMEYFPRGFIEIPPTNPGA
jgi:hypothetical protein